MNLEKVEQELAELRQRLRPSDLKSCILGELIPAELKQRPHWIGWKRVLRVGKDGKPKPTKIPYQLNSPHQKALTNKPTTWTPFPTTVAIDATLHQTEKDADRAEGFAGIGFVFTNSDYAGVDFDHVRDPQTGTVEQWAGDIIDALGSYTEISQSGTGLHAILRLSTPLLSVAEGGRFRAGRLEMYDASSPRFFAMTGNVDGLGVKAIKEVDLRPWQAKLPTLDPRLESSSQKSSRDVDQSSEDFALACKLARQFNCDREKVTEEFRRQAVQRDKVTIRKDYVSRTVEKAIERVLSSAASPGATNVSDVDLTPQWPDPLKPEAFHGLPGEIARGIEPYSEADPAATLVQLIVGFGNVIGRKPFYRVEEDVHFSNEFVVLVGPTSKARKGVSWMQVRRLLEQGDPTWGKRLMPGLSSGEGVVHWVRDARGEDHGESDKRLIVVESEYASVLAKMVRQGNTLSPILRQAWDGGRLGSLTKKASESCDEPHISIIGHITQEELRRSLNRTELANGFANRFMFICVRRSKLLPDGARIPNELRQHFADRLKAAVEFARSVDPMTRDSEARELWHQVYGPLSEGRAGLFGAVIGRAEAHVLRLSCLYALLDSERTIKSDHLRAALAVWKYAEDSALYIFGEATGDPVADAIIAALRNNSGGLTRTAISETFSRNLSKRRLDIALSSLQSQGRAHSVKREVDGGRPAEIWSYGPTKKTN
jgi:hypothetical protein